MITWFKELWNSPWIMIDKRFFWFVLSLFVLSQIFSMGRNKGINDAFNYIERVQNEGHKST